MDVVSFLSLARSESFSKNSFLQLAFEAQPPRVSKMLVDFA